MTWKNLTTATLIIAAACSESDPEDDTDTTPATDGGGTTTDTGPTGEDCDVANSDGYHTAWDIISDCECNEDEVYSTWDLDAYSTDQWSSWPPGI